MTRDLEEKPIDLSFVGRVGRAGWPPGWGVPAAGPPLPQGGESTCGTGLRVRISHPLSKAAPSLPCPLWQLGTAGW